MWWIEFEFVGRQINNPKPKAINEEWIDERRGNKPITNNKSNAIHQLASLISSTPQIDSFDLIFVCSFFMVVWLVLLCSSSLLRSIGGLLPPITHNKKESKPTNLALPLNKSKKFHFFFFVGSFRSCRGKCFHSIILQIFSFFKFKIFRIIPFNTFPWGPLPVNKGNSISPSILKEWAAMNFSFVEWAGPLIN